MSSQGSGPRQRATRGRGGCLSGCFGLLVILALGVLAVFGLDLVSRALFAPWSLSLGGRPTLIGDWAGTLRTASGLRFGLGLHLAYHGSASRGGSGRSAVNIDGSGEICTRRGERFPYEVYGGTNDWGGSHGRLTMRSLDTGVTGSGWGFELAWEGDRLAVAGTNAFELDERPIGGRTHLATLDPVIGELGRASASPLETVCGRLVAEAG